MGEYESERDFMLKRRGSSASTNNGPLRGSPCLTPLSIEKTGERVPLIKSLA